MNIYKYIYVWFMCTFLLTYPLLFSDLRQAVCMRSVLNPDKHDCSEELYFPVIVNRIGTVCVRSVLSC